MAGLNRLYRNIGKPSLDRLLGLILLIGFAPFIGLVAILVRLRLGSPVLFRQERVGKKEHSFELLKFRTMTNAIDGKSQLLSDANRVTPFGRFLRMFSLDELPQLWNVVKGEMSLVGPRPLYPHYMPYYTERERRRHEVRPGMTGLAQVSGRARLPWDERLELDVYYVETMSMWLDWSILLRTVQRVLLRRDALEVPDTDRLTLVDARRDSTER